MGRLIVLLVLIGMHDEYWNVVNSVVENDLKDNLNFILTFFLNIEFFNPFKVFEKEM